MRKVWIAAMLMFGLVLGASGCGEGAKVIAPTDPTTGPRNKPQGNRQGDTSNKGAGKVKPVED